MTRRSPAWHVATVVDSRPETTTARRIELEVPTWPGNDAGAHVDVRLTAPDGYQASRSYSLASSGADTRLVLAVDEVPEGEVSPFLVHDLRAGDQIEVHGPLGAFFIWHPSDDPSPVQLIAGGSGVVPLFAMVSAHAASDDPAPFRLLYSVRSPEDVFFADEISALADDRLRLDTVYTRRTPPAWPEQPGRLTPERLRNAVFSPLERPRIYVCGPTPFVEAVAGWLIDAGHDPARVRTERFGGA